MEDNTRSFYRWDLSILGFWYPGGSWNQPPTDAEGRLYTIILCTARKESKVIVFILYLLKEFLDLG